jgi:ribosomal protein S18 acetylase RimI-like enzyme
MITRDAGLGDRSVEWEAIWLEPGHRRQGLGRRAYERLWQLTRARGYSRVVLSIRADNMRSRYIHQKLAARFAVSDLTDAAPSALRR